jgi:Fe-S-cluster containining protein
MISDMFDSIEGLPGLRRIYQQIDREARTFVEKTALKCPECCGQCCYAPSSNIEATILEMMLPALELWRNGEALSVIDRISKISPDSHCIFFSPQKDPGSGRCSIYPNRALICRLFGIAGNLDKYKKIRFSPCLWMQKEMPDQAMRIRRMLKSGLIILVFSTYRYRVLSLNPLLARELYPINTALALALQRVGYYRQYKGTA